MADGTGTREAGANGAAVAAFLAAGIGAFAVGVMAILNESGLFEAPALYEPAGGVSGRTTIAVVIWVIAWAVLHSRWRDRQVESRRVHLATLLFDRPGRVANLSPRLEAPLIENDGCMQSLAHSLRCGHELQFAFRP